MAKRIFIFLALKIIEITVLVFIPYGIGFFCIGNRESYFTTWVGGIWLLLMGNASLYFASLLILANCRWTKNIIKKGYLFKLRKDKSNG